VCDGLEIVLAEDGEDGRSGPRKCVRRRAACLRVLMIREHGNLAKLKVYGGRTKDRPAMSELGDEQRFSRMMRGGLSHFGWFETRFFCTTIVPDRYCCTALYLRGEDRSRKWRTEKYYSSTKNILGNKNLKYKGSKAEDEISNVVAGWRALTPFK